MDNKQDTSTLDILQTSTDVVKTINSAVKTGKAVSNATMGMPYVVPLLLWGNRDTIAKLIMAVAFIMLLPILFILMLPSIIFNTIDPKENIKICPERSILLYPEKYLDFKRGRENVDHKAVYTYSVFFNI